ncbi:MAG: hypothetical protein E6R08_04855 [Nevskiaceae bacterium]|nr:MAG: hypothetical protein E6R08_04855 [Nevskiaceae bacterium]
MKQQIRGGATSAAFLWKTLVATGALSLMATLAVADDAVVPRHLQIARDFVANTKPENNSYSNKNPYTKMPGDFLASEYVVATDCSRFVEDMFRRAKSGVVEQLHTKSLKNSYSIRDWHPSVEREEAFTRIWKAADMKPGDVAVWLYVNTGDHTLPGHMLFIDSEPVKLAKPRKPIVEGLDQYEVTIIDTSQEAKSRDDTRFVSDAALRDANEAKGKERGSVTSPNQKGVGRGRIRFYADAAGDIKGVAFSFDKAKFHGLDDWNIVVGRPKLKAN